MRNHLRPSDWPCQICCKLSGNNVTITKKQCVEFQACICISFWAIEAYKKVCGPNFTVKTSATEKVTKFQKYYFWTIHARGMKFSGFVV